MDNRSFNWQFYLVDVHYPILSGDAFAHYHLSPDLVNSRFIHSSGQVYELGTVALGEDITVSLVDSSQPCAELFRGFSMIVGLANLLPVYKDHKVIHCIEIYRPLVVQKTRRWSTDKLKIAKLEFEKLCKLGLLRPSSSPWSSPFVW